MTGWVRLGQAHHALADYPHALASLRRAVEALEGALRQGRWGEAIPALRAALDLAGRGAPPGWFPLLASPLGMAYAMAGDTGAGLPLLEQAVERAAAEGFLGLQALRTTWLAGGYLEARRPEEAAAAARRALELSRRTKERGHEAHALRGLGEALSHGLSQDPAEAARSYRQAMGLADELGMRPLEAECRLGLGDLYGRCGDAERARPELAAACERFRAMGMLFWLHRAEAALEALRRDEGAEETQA